MKITLFGTPISKKNSQQIVRIGNRPGLVQSKAYRQYEKDCMKQIVGAVRIGVNAPVNVKCLYYMPTRRKVDLLNLLEATNDILVKAGVLEDDNSKIVISHDGSRVLYDKVNPRVEIEIMEVQHETLFDRLP